MGDPWGDPQEKNSGLLHCSINNHGSAPQLEVGRPLLAAVELTPGRDFEVDHERTSSVLVTLRRMSCSSEFGSESDSAPFCCPIIKSMLLWQQGFILTFTGEVRRHSLACPMFVQCFFSDRGIGSMHSKSTALVRFPTRKKKWRIMHH